MVDLNKFVAALLEDQGALGLDGIPAALLRASSGSAAPWSHSAQLPAGKAQPIALSPPTAPPRPTLEIAKPAQHAIVAPPVTRAPPTGDLAAIRADLGDCTRCKLHKSRKNIVFGVGDPRAKLVFVGEGPGADEDTQGEPFVGKAGQLLTKMIEAMGYQRSEVYIANVVKCRPPNNRDPEPDEVAACEPFLVQQLGAISPEVIVTLGKHAAQTILRDPQSSITKLRGKWREYQGIKVMPTFHPSYLLRDPTQKKWVWQDLQEVMKLLGVKASART